MNTYDGNEIFEALKGAADGAFVVDDELQIQFWNDSAEKILGFKYSEVVGQFCYHVLQSSDEENQLICMALCPVSKLAFKSKPIPNYDIQTRTSQGDTRWLNMSILTLNMGRDRHDKLIIHLFRDLTDKKKDEIFFHKILETAQRYYKTPLNAPVEKDPPDLHRRLTKRQREVLILLVRGFSTQEIAEKLSISRNTARNHIQHILQILQVHSRLEAVSYVLKNNLMK